ncbi:FHA domain-containing protein [Leucobacter aridicollis]|uniref:FHA domain-containing protein n=1 Tax=Leucobacter aridicollis TaxID=283878 RepID=UPI00210545F5|nr:FHA domain-containing protein [Leucobacter aridicollis]UTX53286.1 FHA domain-containing protein [Leucobacter aridicollis]
MTDTFVSPAPEPQLLPPAAANRLARCRFCSTLNEYVDGEPAPLCTRCGLDLSVPAHLRPLDVGVLLAQLGHEPTRDNLAASTPTDSPTPSLLDQLLEEVDTPASSAAPVRPSPGTPAQGVPPLAPVSPAPFPVAPVAPVLLSPATSGMMSRVSEVDVSAMTVAVSREVEDMDNTVMVSRSAETNCVLVLPDGSEYPLSTDTIVGRRPEASLHVQTLALPDATKTLSRTHARVWFDGTQWCVEDLGSVNGVSVLAEDNTEVVLEPGVATPLMSPRFKLGTLEVSLAVPSA